MHRHLWLPTKTTVWDGVTETKTTSSKLFTLQVVKRFKVGFVFKKTISQAFTVLIEHGSAQHLTIKQQTYQSMAIQLRWEAEQGKQRSWRQPRCSWQLGLQRSRAQVAEVVDLSTTGGTYGRIARRHLLFLCQKSVNNKEDVSFAVCHK